MNIKFCLLFCLFLTWQSNKSTGNDVNKLTFIHVSDFDNLKKAKMPIALEDQKALRIHLKDVTTRFSLAMPTKVNVLLNRNDCSVFMFGSIKGKNFAMKSEFSENSLSPEKNYIHILTSRLMVFRM